MCVETADLLVIVPSRERPEAVAGLVQAIERTSTGLTALIVAVDLSDPQGEHYPEAASKAPNLPGVLTLEHTRSAAAALNKAAVRYAPAAFAVAYLPDCQRPVASGWDRMLVDALRGGYGFAQGHEVAARPGIRPRHIAMRSDVITELGAMVPDALDTTMWADCWARWAAATGGMATCDDVVIQRDPAIVARRGLRRNTRGWNEYDRGELHRDVDALRALANRTWLAPS